jgi:hypothetical protein
VRVSRAYGLLDGDNPGCALYDHDGDGRLDLAVFGGYQDLRGTGVAFLRGDGVGGFAERSVRPTAYDRRYGARFDANLDGGDEVVVVGGDGDAYSIGGNHFLHACRRNVDLAYIVMDNRVYGMTKGQPSPTTEPEWDSALVPGGSGLRPFNPLAIAVAAGAGWVGRAFSGDPNALAKLIHEAITWPGFALLEVLSPCVTFRPEEREWKAQVHPTGAPAPDAPTAAATLLADDGFGVGVFYRSAMAPPRTPDVMRCTLADIEMEVAL